MTGRAQRYGNLENVIGNGKGGIGGAVDSTTGSLNVQRTDDPRFDDVSDPTLINEANLAIDTHNFPDDNGVSHLGYKSLSFAGTINGNTITFQVWGYNGTQWLEVTQMFTTNAGVSPPGTIQAAGSAVLFGIHTDHFPYQKWRATLVVAASATNSATIGSYQKAI